MNPDNTETRVVKGLPAIISSCEKEIIPHWEKVIKDYKESPKHLLNESVEKIKAEIKQMGALFAEFEPYAQNSKKVKLIQEKLAILYLESQALYTDYFKEALKSEPKLNKGFLDSAYQINRILLLGILKHKDKFKEAETYTDALDKIIENAAKDWWLINIEYQVAKKESQNKTIAETFGLFQKSMKKLQVNNELLRLVNLLGEKVYQCALKAEQDNNLSFLKPACFKLIEHCTQLASIYVQQEKDQILALLATAVLLYNDLSSLIDNYFKLCDSFIEDTAQYAHYLDTIHVLIDIANQLLSHSLFSPGKAALQAKNYSRHCSLLNERREEEHRLQQAEAYEKNFAQLIEQFSESKLTNSKKKEKKLNKKSKNNKQEQKFAITTSSQDPLREGKLGSEAPVNTTNKKKNKKVRTKPTHPEKKSLNEMEVTTSIAEKSNQIEMSNGLASKPKKADEHNSKLSTKQGVKSYSEILHAVGGSPYFSKIKGFDKASSTPIPEPHI